MFKKKDNDTGQEMDEGKEEKPEAKKNTLPLVIDLEYPYEYAKKTVTQLICDRRPPMRTIKAVMSAGDDDAEVMEIIYEHLFDKVPAESDIIDAEDGIKAFEKVFDFFPHLAGGEDA